MPKMTKVFGPERTNLMYAIIGHLMNTGYSSLAELAERFGYSEAEIEAAARSIGVSEAGDNADYGGSPFELNYEALEDEGIVEFNNYSLDMGTPRLTTKQTAAISAGLKVLEQIPGFEYADEVRNLIAILHRGAGGLDEDTITVDIGETDTNLLLVRKAILEGVSLKCDYRNASGQLTAGRIIEPLRVESRDLVWYLRGFCISKHQEVRVFRLDAIENLALTDRPIDPEHASLKLEGDLYEAGTDAVSVLLEVDPEAYAVLRDYKAEYQKPASGTITAEIKVTHLSTLAPIVASYGGAVRVLAPVEARGLVRDYALAALGELNRDGAAE